MQHRSDAWATPTIYHQSWWLDITTDGNWNAAKQYSDGKLIGWMPYAVKQRMGFKESRMPPLTHFLGPAIDPGVGGVATRFARVVSVTRALIGDLPRVACYTQKMHRKVDHVIPFQMENFNSSVQFSFELASTDQDAAWTAMRDKTRNVIRTAAKGFKLIDSVEPGDFTRLYESNIAAAGKVLSRDLGIMKRLITACYERHCGRIFSAVDRDNRVKAAIFCMWDDEVMYYLTSTRHKDCGNGTISLLVWEAIKHAIANRMTFDFDGVGSGGSVLFYAGFGATSHPRYTISRLTPPYRVLREARRLFRGEDNYFTDSN